jgi:hypothetical protein
LLILLIDQQLEAELERDLKRSYRKQKIKAKKNSVFLLINLRDISFNLFKK